MKDNGRRSTAARSRTSDLAGAEIAMRRAARMARERARRFGIGVAVWKENQVVIEDPGLQQKTRTED